MKQTFLEMINNHITETNTFEDYNVRPRLNFKYNGLDYSLSIQASCAAYCQPRDSSSDYYEEVELGYPSFFFSDKFISQYAEDEKYATDTVYPYVPVTELAEELETIFNGEVVWTALS